MACEHAEQHDLIPVIPAQAGISPEERRLPETQEQACPTHRSTVGTTPGLTPSATPSRPTSPSTARSARRSRSITMASPSSTSGAAGTTRTVSASGTATRWSTSSRQPRGWPHSARTDWPKKADSTSTLPSPSTGPSSARQARRTSRSATCSRTAPAWPPSAATSRSTKCSTGIRSPAPWPNRSPGGRRASSTVTTR